MYIVCQYNIAQYIVFKAILLSKEAERPAGRVRLHRRRRDRRGNGGT